MFGFRRHQHREVMDVDGLYGPPSKAQHNTTEGETHGETETQFERRPEALAEEEEEEEVDDENLPPISRMSVSLVRCPNAQTQSGFAEEDLVTHNEGEAPATTTGCPWRGALDELDCHLDECGWQNVVCDLCDRMMLRRSLRRHVESECRDLFVACPVGCGEEMPKDHLSVHLKNRCRHVRVRCKHAGSGCPAAVQRQALAQHYRECEFRTIRCPFYDMGCHVVLVKKDLKQHLLDDILKHTNLQVERVRDLEEQVERLKKTKKRPSVKVPKARDEDGKHQRRKPQLSLSKSLSPAQQKPKPKPRPKERRGARGGSTSSSTAKKEKGSSKRRNGTEKKKKKPKAKKSKKQDPRLSRAQSMSSSQLLRRRSFGHVHDC